jgi:hypothetical protein
MTHFACSRLLACTAVPLTLLPGLAAAQEALFSAEVVAASGTVHVTLPAPDADGVSGCYIYAGSLRSGLGSPDVRLDRGMLGNEQLLCFRQVGNMVAARFENPRFIATGDARTAAGARESFAFTIAAMLPVVAAGRDGALTVDLKPLLSADAMDIATALNGDGTGYRHAPTLSGVDTASLRVFPDNLEIDTVQTFTSDNPGPEAEAIAPDARQVSFIVHHSLIRLPEPGFVPRLADPRAPVSGPLIYDFGAPLGQPVAIQLAARFRLERTDPTAERSTVVEPIVFYIDPAAPEPVRTALIEGVNYWQSAFEAAGFIDAFRAELLPEGADPLDVRYNMVNWANRLTRGWSYGGGIRDPRTGEIIRGNVVIGALRVRQDIVIFEGLVGTALSGTGDPNDPVEVALSRIRQLAAHEVGHALGFMHNFAASTQDRTSVMDYPGPRIGLVDGHIDLSDAYASGGGAWDDFSVDWLYGDPAPGIDPDAHAAEKAAAPQVANLHFMTDIDGRSSDLPSPVASMWDDGADPVAALEHMLAVREVALANFGEGSLLPGEPMTNLQRKFVPMWLLHRYDVEAVGKVLGGLDYEYAVRGDDHPSPAPFPAAMQMAALELLLQTMTPARLTVPDHLVILLSHPTTRLPDPQHNQEIFDTNGAAAFDPLEAADAAATLTLASLLAPARLARVLEQNRRDPSLPGVAEVLRRIDEDALVVSGDPLVQRIAWRTALTMAQTGHDPATPPEVAALVFERLTIFGRELATARGPGAAWANHLASLLANREALSAVLGESVAEPQIPPGMPIGGDTGWFDE